MSTTENGSAKRVRLGPITAAERETFIAALRDSSTVSGAARLAGRGRQRFHDLKDRDEAFAQEWAEAWDEGTDALEDEAVRRAKGYAETTFGPDGEVLRTVQRFDTVALIGTLKARRPELWRDNAQPLTPVTIILQSAFADPPVQGEVVDGDAVEVRSLALADGAT